MPSELDMAIAWIAKNVVANEATRDPLPSIIKERLARFMVLDSTMGWPDQKSALAYLEATFNWY